VALEATAIIRVDSVGPTLASRIFNAGEGGMLLVMPQARPLGTRISITVQIATPPTEIHVSGIIVHVQPLPGHPPGGAVKAGIALTEISPEWTDLCRRLAQLSGESVMKP
jgi:hypothetical protein